MLYSSVTPIKNCIVLSVNLYVHIQLSNIIIWSCVSGHLMNISLFTPFLVSTNLSF